MIKVRLAEKIPGLLLALVEVNGARVGPSSPALREECEQAAAQVRETGWPNMEVRKKEIRDLLRTGGFKPSGRNKPAQEYLLRTVTQEEGLPSIANAVDLLNAISLQSGIPISLVSLDRVGIHLAVRYGQPGERYVFNTGGQELDLKGLICLCTDDQEGATQPVANPVKDSMKAKLDDGDSHLLACFYASETAISYGELHRWALKLGNDMLKHCDADDFEVTILKASEQEAGATAADA